MRPYATNRISDYVLRYSQKVDIPDNILFEALDIAQELEETHLFFMSGKSSSGLAAGVLYVAGLLHGGSLAQRDLCQVLCESGICKIMPPTVKKHYRGILHELGLLNTSPDAPYPSHPKNLQLNRVGKFSEEELA